MTRTSPPSCTRPTATRTPTRRSSTARSASPPRWRRAQSASDEDPDDEWEAADCGSGFEFPDDEALVQAEFERNIPFAIAVALSAHDPDDPVSVVGREAADFQPDTFDVSYGDPQTVAVWAKRALKNVRMRYRVDGGPVRTTTVSEWTDGERYGDENNDYYGEFRGVVSGASAGDDVEVWFTGVKPGEGPVQSEPFTYTVEQDTGADVLVIANEDYTGVNPTYPAGTNQPKYDEAHVAALEAAGYSADVWDVDADGIPHDLGVLGHYDALVWYLGDNRITQDPQDVTTASPFGNLPETGVAERQQYLTMRVRDYLNDGGKLIHAGETAQYEGLFGISDIVGGLYYAANGDDTSECVDHVDGGLLRRLPDPGERLPPVLPGRVPAREPRRAGLRDRDRPPLEGYEALLGGGTNPLNEAGVFTVTSDVLPVEEFPQFESWAAAAYDPWPPSEGSRFAGAAHADDSYMRLTRTFDLTGRPPRRRRSCSSTCATTSRQGYDHVIVEARTAGGSDWTTLPDLNGGTVTDAPEECVAGGFLFDLHPFLDDLPRRGLRRDRVLERVHRRQRRLRGGRVRPLRVRRQAGGDLDLLRHRPEHRWDRGGGRRHAARRRRRDGVRRRVRGCDERLGRRPGTGRQPGGRRQLGGRRAADRPDRGNRDGGHAAAGLRPRAAGHRGRSGGAARAGARRPPAARTRRDGRRPAGRRPPAARSSGPARPPPAGGGRA